MFLYKADKIPKKIPKIIAIEIAEIARIIEDRKTIYDLKVDSKEEKFNPKNKLIKVSEKEMPKYINENISKFKDWID